MLGNVLSFLSIAIAFSITAVTTEWSGGHHTAVLWMWTLAVVFFCFGIAGIVWPYLRRIRMAAVPIGSLALNLAVLECDFSQRNGMFSAEHYIEVENSTDYLLSFTATLSGTINGNSWGKISVKGYINQKKTFKLVGKRLNRIPFPHNSFPELPSLIGVMDYEIVYKKHGSKKTRRTGKRVISQLWMPIILKMPGTEENFSITTLYRNEIEA